MPLAALQPALAAGPALSDTPIPMATEEELPPRTAPLIEIGPAFLGAGNLPEGFELPTGAVWNPAFWVFGSYRTALDYFDRDGSGSSDATAEWTNRLDLFGNLQLSGTERVLIGVSPLRHDGRFSGYAFESPSGSGFDNALNLRLTTLFFEGEIAEIFPDLDARQSGVFDLGFSVGRQPLFFQEGIMINDTTDALALTRETIIVPGLSVDTRVTALWGWGDVNREDNREDDKAQLFGLFAESDVGSSTVQLDAAYVASDADGLNLGAASTQRLTLFGKTIDSSFRINQSWALDQESEKVSTGTLLFAELNMTPSHTDNVLYANGFLGIDDFTSASRGETVGGPLGQAGLLFANVGLGRYDAPLNNRAGHVVGGALGYQLFFNDERTQLIFELGGRLGTDSSSPSEAALGSRFQQAIGDRFVVRVDGFVSAKEDGIPGFGARTEFVTQF
ncbi:hypothetical protein SAMN06265365_13041 [Tistlia consotensis]|uniref:Porin n=1 Tax=Tistlia consotensis USBA 355 TaxID=560819 RepID=A0A1Y6CKZ6_9PROT|nr:hypothetical protein [Tistlia consotensis]SMF72583.1 hypothetical protein SAMN05428998_13141 [Tistlia consotensis USBA 355]SNS09447.1 hypothetical protein SAMN06265365_13041 [Tistlia consotensis]